MKNKCIQSFKTISFLVVIINLLNPLASAQSTTNRVERWGVFEITLKGPASVNPYLDVQTSATFTQGDQRFTVPGFWESGDSYKVRFSPPTTGEWRYKTYSGACNEEIMRENQ